MNEGGVVFIQMLFFIIRIMIIIYCVNKAGKLNRSKFGWGVFAFFIPIPAIIIIQFMKPKMVWDKNVPLVEEQ